MTDPITEPDEAPASGPASAPPVGEADGEGPEEGPSLEAQVAELTDDLKRKQAEFINYKRRVEDDRVKAVEKGKQDVLSALLPVLDDLGLAEQHGELTGGFKAVADKVQATVARFGLEPFGTAGEPFDPQVHEAVFHAGEDPNVEVTSIAQVMQTGYKVGDRVLRAATVGVVDPGVAAEAETEPTEPTED